MMAGARRKHEDVHPPQVGPAIRAKRRQLNRTLQDLADAAGISVGYLSQVERGLATPSLGTMERLSRALKIGLDYFIATPRTQDAMTRNGQRQEFFVGSSSIGYERIGAAFAGNELSSFVLNIPPGYHSETASHEGEEILFLLEGSLMQRIGEEEVVLNTGDSLHFRSNARHSWWNDSDKPARLLWVGTSNIFRA